MGIPRKADKKILVYRKIDPKIWNDEKFRPLSDDSKLVFLFLLTHPHMTALGAMRATLPGLAAELAWPWKRFRTAVSPLRSKAMIEVNEQACYVAIPKFLRYNEPEGPNSVTKAWPRAASLIPECPEKEMLIQGCRSYLEGRSDEFRSAMGDVMSHAMWGIKLLAISDAESDPCPIQEHEPEPEPKQQPEEEKDTPPAVSSSFKGFWNLYPMRNGKRLGRAKAFRQWNRLSPNHQKLVMRAVQHYAASKNVADGIGIKDPHRWLGAAGHDEPWREWIEPEEVAAVNNQAALLSCSKRIQGPHDRFLRPCGQPASRESKPEEPRCDEHLIKAISPGVHIC
jgi:hypothetical protein